MTQRDSAAFARSLGWSFPVTGDPAGAVSARYRVGTPTLIALITGRGAQRIDYSRWASANAATQERPAVQRKAPRRRTKLRCRVVHHKRSCRRVRTRAKQQRRRKPPVKKPAALSVHPVFVSSFDWQASLGQDRYVLIRYLHLDRDARGASDDAVFAAGAARGAAGFTALAVTCAQPGTVTAQLRAAQITAPVIVDTNPACTSELDASLHGITQTNYIHSGSERLFSSVGQPLASELVVGTSFLAYNHQHPTAKLQVDDWMGGLPPPEDADWSDGSFVLDVPIPASVHAIANVAFVAATPELALRGFWYACPGCVADQSDYQLEAWADAHPGASVAAFTCDADVNEAADWAYEHGWTFPVYVYDGDLDFGDCFDRVAGGRLGLDPYYGATGYYSGGVYQGDWPPSDYAGFEGTD